MNPRSLHFTLVRTFQANSFAPRSPEIIPQRVCPTGVMSCGCGAKPH